MEFSVTFIGKSENKNDYTDKIIFETKPCDVGITIIEDIRKYFNLTEKELPISKIKDTTACRINKKLTIHLLEPVVLKCITETGVNVFANFSNINVFVPEQFLTPYQSVTFEKEYDDNRIKGIFSRFKKEPIFYISIKPIILHDDIITDWIKAKCPLSWGYK